jgi:hypothetical protein
VNVSPIPYEGRLLRVVRRAQEHAAYAAIVEQLAREVDGDVSEERKRLHAPSPMDLRGIPAIGPGWSGGAIAGSRPGDNLR